MRRLFFVLLMVLLASGMLFAQGTGGGRGSGSMGASNGSGSGAATASAPAGTASRVIQLIVGVALLLVAAAALRRRPPAPLQRQRAALYPRMWPHRVVPFTAARSGS